MTTAVIDGDIVAYTAAAIAQETYEFTPGSRAVFLDRERAKREANKLINKYADQVGADDVIVALSDPVVNFRKELWKGYKRTRTPDKKPELLQEVRSMIDREWTVRQRPTLEGDDVIGQLVTQPGGFDKYVVVSIDKDLRGVPCQLYNPERPDEGIVEVDRLDADRFFYTQVLTGDPVDEYPGCPGVGPKSPYVLAVNAATDEEDMWAVVTRAYTSKRGRRPVLTEEDALGQALMARILRHNERPGKWRPPGRSRLHYKFPLV